MDEFPIYEPGLTKAIKEGMAFPSVVDWRKQGIVTAVKDQVRKGGQQEVEINVFESRDRVAVVLVTLLRRWVRWKELTRLQEVRLQFLASKTLLTAQVSLHEYRYSIV